MANNERVVAQNLVLFLLGNQARHATPGRLVKPGVSQFKRDGKDACSPGMTRVGAAIVPKQNALRWVDYLRLVRPGNFIYVSVRGSPGLHMGKGTEWDATFHDDKCRIKWWSQRTA